MIVCVCNEISEGDIIAAIETGCKSFDEVLNKHKVKFECKICEEVARKFFKLMLGIKK